MKRTNGTKPQTFESAVERALITALNGISALEPTDKIKLLGVASRYVAIRARLTTAEHGSAFLDDPDEDLDKL